MLVKETKLRRIKLKGRGKVRDIYDLEDKLLIVATDRISAFDVIMDEAIPDKGRVLTAISAFWFDQVKDVMPNHVLSLDPADVPGLVAGEADLLSGRMMLVRKARPLPVECIVRGYLSGSGWQDYQVHGAVCGIALPEGLRESDELPRPIFTPSTKAELGEHDVNISLAEMAEMIGAELTARIRDASLKIYDRARGLAQDKGIIIADTKFEFGLVNEDLLLIDEALTPDSSRFWPTDQYQPGQAQPSFDKQYLRDWLASLDWDKTPPPPRLPQEVIDQTRARYIEALERLTGRGFK